MAETNAAALCEAGRRDAQALTVTGRRRARTGSIRHAARTLAHAAKAVTPETPNGAWLRDNRTLARTAASDAAAALRHAHTLRASGAQTVLHVCCAGLLRACGNALTPKTAQAYLAGFQDVLPLETAELALLVPGLQAATVCALADTYAHDGAAAPALFTSLRALGTAAWAALTERCDRVGRILARDPAGVYPAMDAATRTRYRQTVARLARRTGRSEIDIAEDVRARAQSGEGARQHVGWFLLREVLGAPEKRHDGAWYIAAVIVGTLALSLLLGFALGSISLLNVSRTAALTSLIIPLIVAGVPIIDTFSAIVRRKRAHISIGQADKGHIHHRLIQEGYNQRQAVLLIYAWCIMLSAGAAAINQVEVPMRVLIFTVLAIGSAAFAKHLHLFEPVLRHHYNKRTHENELVTPDDPAFKQEERAAEERKEERHHRR